MNTDNASYCVWYNIVSTEFVQRESHFNFSQVHLVQVT